jgi:hypothetical protein
MKKESFKHREEREKFPDKRTQQEYKKCCNQEDEYKVVDTLEDFWKEMGITPTRLSQGDKLTQGLL